jgi:hypothetical protein
MPELYNRVLNAILKKYPDHEEKMGLLPEEYPEHYECRYVLNGYMPKAFHLANDGENRLMLSIFPAAISGNYTYYTIHNIFDYNGISFTSDNAEVFLINIDKPLSVLHISGSDDSVDEYLPYTEKKLMGVIFKSLKK